LSREGGGVSFKVKDGLERPASGATMAAAVNLLYPSIPRARLVATFRLAAIGALVAAAYGALHDQASYAISHEYFTKMKFVQFAWADVGLAPRAFASEVGALASWWVGAIAGWSLGRVGFADPPTTPRRDVVRAFAIVLGAAVVGGAVGAALGVVASRDVSGWREWTRELWLADTPSFVVVAYLHAGSYAGGALGLVAAVIDARRRRAVTPTVRPA